MWKVMVADDEIYVLEALEKLIDWEKMDCKLVFKAKNGQELLEQLEIEIPDIIITDIIMPLINGIEVAKYIYDHNLPTKVIILSVYTEFEYAREAIMYDVCGYVVKTSAIETLPEIIHQTTRKLSVPTDLHPKNDSTASSDILEKLQKYIALHYTEKLTLKQISSSIHANGSYLSRLYKKKNGQNLFDAINQMKLKKAKEYMQQGYKISEAAQLVGFDDISYFSRVFKKFEGCTPREYEQLIKKL